ncbi:MAG TPA: hypothetical protein PLP32_00140, partial [Accumulibacter sp.]|nr:hypothetical protein [Accumulibacter sp.]
MGIVAYQEWPIENALLIDADERNCKSLSKIAELHGGWSVKQSLIDKVNGETDFFLASNAAESGLLVPETLAPIWRNLKTIGEQRLEGVRLDSLLSSRGPGAKLFNWVFISCFPAAHIAESMGDFLEGVDVLVARVALPTAGLSGVGADLSSVDQLLAGRGFRCLQVAESRQPELGHVIYVRDSKQEVEKLAADRDQQVKTAAERQQQIEQLSQAKVAAEKLAAERAQQVEQANKAKAEQSQLASERQAQLEKLSADRDQQVKTAAERQQQIEQLS